jgi:hypothetical protein
MIVCQGGADLGRVKKTFVHFYSPSVTLQSGQIFYLSPTRHIIRSDWAGSNLLFFIYNFWVGSDFFRFQ